MPEFLGFRFN